MAPKFSPPSKVGISGLKVIFFFPLLPLGAIVGGVVDFFLCKRGGEAGKEGFSANEKKAWRKIWCGFFFQFGCNGHGALPPDLHSWQKSITTSISCRSEDVQSGQRSTQRYTLPLSLMKQINDTRQPRPSAWTLKGPLIMSTRNAHFKR